MSKLEQANRFKFCPNLNISTLNQVETFIQIKTGYQLNSLQKIILFKSLYEPNKTYEKIAEEVQYSPSYIKRYIAPQLWQLLSSVFEERVSKANCREQLQKIFMQLTPPQNLLKFPLGAVPLNSAYYIERSPLEQIGYKAILTPGALIQVKSLKQMGKTSVIERIIEKGKQQGYHTVYLTLKLAEHTLLNSETKFFRWLCANTTQQLSISSQLEQYWDQDSGSIMNCTVYFQSYILPALEHPLLLVIEDIDQLLNSVSLYRDFLSMIRCWFEKVHTHDSPSWQKLRIVLSYSTEIYGILGVNLSPLNFGFCLELIPFSLLQVFVLAQRHGLNLSEQQLTQVMELSGGFPYLVQRLFYEQINSSDLTGKELIETAPKDSGIFREYLQEKLELLEQNRVLVEVYKTILNTDEPIQINRKQTSQLKSLGLVHVENGKVRVSCGLYRQYFREHLE